MSDFDDFLEFTSSHLKLSESVASDYEKAVRAYFRGESFRVTSGFHIRNKDIINEWRESDRSTKARERIGRKYGIKLRRTYQITNGIF